jgi:hypothetical protein
MRSYLLKTAVLALGVAFTASAYAFPTNPFPHGNKGRVANAFPTNPFPNGNNGRVANAFPTNPFPNGNNGR